MAININALLALPEKQRRKIAGALLDNLAPAYAVSKEEENTLAFLEERLQNIQAGKSVLYSAEELKNMIKEYRNNK